MAIDLEQRREAIRADRKAARMSGAGGPTQRMQGDDEKIQVAGALKALKPLLFPSKAGEAFTRGRDEVREAGREAGEGSGLYRPLRRRQHRCCLTTFNAQLMKRLRQSSNVHADHVLIVRQRR